MSWHKCTWTWYSFIISRKKCVLCLICSAVANFWKEVCTALVLAGLSKWHWSVKRIKESTVCLNTIYYIPLASILWRFDVFGYFVSVLHRNLKCVLRLYWQVCPNDIDLFNRSKKVQCAWIQITFLLVLYCDDLYFLLSFCLCVSQMCCAVLCLYLSQEKLHWGHYGRYWLKCNFLF